MKVTRKALEDAADKQIISHQQAEQLYSYLNTLPQAGPGFNFTNVLYYLGGLIAIGAMSLFMTLGWEAFGGWGIFFIALAYAGVGLKLSARFHNNGYAIPAGICATFVVALTPLAIYGLQQALGLWPDGSAYREYHAYIKWHWIFMELGTLAAGAAMIWRYRYPFLVMPIAVTLWYMSMDIVMMLNDGQYSYELRELVSLYFGLSMILLAFWVDFRSRHSADYAFWLYVFGVFTFWSGFGMQYFESDSTKLFYFCINLLMIVIGVVIVRRVFAIFGAIGASMYFGYLSWEVFADSWLFPIALTAIGLCIILLGVQWQKNEQVISVKVRSVLPQALREFLENKAS